MSKKKRYSNQFKKLICQLICDLGHSTIRTAEEYDVSLKTLEKWITSYHKDSKCFDKSDDYYQIMQKKYNERYDHLSTAELIAVLKQQDDEIHLLQTILKSYEIKKRIQREKGGK